MIALSCSNIKKSYGIDVILENINFTIETGDRIGLIGRNGAGKSTLFRIITGEISNDTGDIFKAKDLTTGYLEQAPDIKSDENLFDFCLPVFQDLIDMELKLRSMETQIAELSAEHQAAPEELMEEYSHILEDFSNRNGYGYKSEIRGVLKGLGFNDEEIARPVRVLSGGQKSRVNIAKLLLKKPDILLLDEPTNHLDIQATNWLEGFLSGYPGTLIVISHDRYFLDQVVNRIFEIENTQLLSHKGSYSDFAKFKRARYEEQIKAYENQQKEIQKQEELIRKFKQHGTEKLAKRAQSREKRLDQVERLGKPVWVDERAHIHLSTQVKSGNDVLHVKDLAMAFPNTPLFENLNFDIYKEERIGLIGPNGIGKTTLFKLLLSQLEPIAGEIKLGHHVMPGYYDQEQSGLNSDNDIVEEISDANPSLTVPEIRTLLGAFLFKGDDVFKNIGQLSGGEKGRVSLLKLMLSKSNFLLLDEPTNHLDISSKEALEDAVMGYDGTLLSISHDRYFLNRVCTKIFDMQADGVKIYYGNYDYYREKVKQAELLSTEDEEAPLKTKTQIRDERRKEKEQAAEARKLKKAQEQLESDIHTTEEQLEAYEAELCLESVYSDPDKSLAVHVKLTETRAKLDELYETWEQLI